MTLPMILGIATSSRADGARFEFAVPTGTFTITPLGEVRLVSSCHDVDWVLVRDVNGRLLASSAAGEGRPTLDGAPVSRQWTEVVLPFRVTMGEGTIHVYDASVTGAAIDGGSSSTRTARTAGSSSRVAGAVCPPSKPRDGRVRQGLPYAIVLALSIVSGLTLQRLARAESAAADVADVKVSPQAPASPGEVTPAMAPATVLPDARALPTSARLVLTVEERRAYDRAVAALIAADYGLAEGLFRRLAAAHPETREFGASLRVIATKRR